MDKALLLKVKLRERTGSKAAVVLRKQGRIPAIIYGHKAEPVAVSVDARVFTEGLHHGHRLMDVQIGRKKQKMIVKDVQYDHLGKDIIHADFMRVDIGEMVRVNVPVELKGTAKGMNEGGIIEENADHLEIECRVTDIPESIVVSVKEMGVGDALHASDVELAEGLKLISSPDTLLAACHLVAAAKTTEELEQEAPAAPEVITEAKPEEQKDSQADTG